VGRQFAEENNPLNVHYDASKEVRAKGAGFYQFSADEETRLKQMEELKSVREETERKRQELGAEDAKPGEEGMTVEGVKSKAMEKRKRELEERKKLIEAKRKKARVADEGSIPSVQPPVTLAKSSESIPNHHTGVAEHSEKKSTAAVSDDPFAVLEGQTKSGREKKGKDNATSEAESFLSQLAQEFLATKAKR